MNDALLGDVKTLNERAIKILEWYKKTESKNPVNNSIYELMDAARERWHSKERQKSWVSNFAGSINLSVIGASVGSCYLDFKKFLISNPDFDGVVIHQIPSLTRLYLKFNDTQGRVNVLPNSTNFGFDKKYYIKEIKEVHDKYKRLMMRDLGKKINKRILQKLYKLYPESYYITENPQDVPASIPKEKIIIDNFENVRSQFPKGTFGHNVGDRFNRFIIDKVRSIL